jgi:hypothetical protein
VDKQRKQFAGLALIHTEQFVRLDGLFGFFKFRHDVPRQVGLARL